MFNVLVDERGNMYLVRLGEVVFTNFLSFFFVKEQGSLIELNVGKSHI